MTRLTLRIDFDDSRHLGHGKVKLLELIDRNGSIASAARDMEMSYRRAWLLVDEVNKMFDTPVVETKLGGKGGGLAALTMFGRSLVQIYRGMEADALQAFARRIGALESKLALGAAAAPRATDDAAKAPP